jgi:hypothetical protein
MVRTQNNKSYIVAGLVLFSLIAARANQSKTGHFIQYGSCFANVIL